VDEAARAKEVCRPILIVEEHPIDRAGELLAAALIRILAEQDRARLAIPGGSALEAACRAQLALKNDWQRVALTWVDERCVPVDDERSNRGEARRRGLLTINEDRETSGPALRLPLFEDGETPEQALRRVRLGWKNEFSERLDVVLIGMGADGHIASIFPSSPTPRATREDHWVSHIADSPKPPTNRITLTRAALATARHVILVAAGEAKRDALKRLLSGDRALPAEGLEGLAIVTDLELEAAPGPRRSRESPERRSERQDQKGEMGSNGESNM
jgi:6-phosphogluconolactonase